MKKNVKNLVSAYNEYANSFNSAIRWIVATAKEKQIKLPEAPAKDDKSEEAKQLRAEIKKAEAYNNNIGDCAAIVEHFSITANDLKGGPIKELRKRIMMAVPNVDETGRAVKFVKLPAYLKNEIKDYATIFQVVPASWIEAICAASDNTECKRNEYVLTISPIVKDGEIEIIASGDLISAEGEKIETGEIFGIWNKEAVINNIASAAGRATTQATKAELKAK